MGGCGGKTINRTGSRIVAPGANVPKKPDMSAPVVSRQVIPAVPAVSAVPVPAVPKLSAEEIRAREKLVRDRLEEGYALPPKFEAPNIKPVSGMF